MALLLFETVNVPSSFTLPVSFWATGASLTPVTVIVKFAVSVPPLPSEIVYTNTSVTISLASKASAAAWSATYVYVPSAPTVNVP